MPYHECPSFEKCSRNVCPLDPRMDEKFNLPGEEQCKAHKPTRMRIGAKYDLPFGGLTPREFNGKKRWDDLDPVLKAKITEDGAKRFKTMQEARIKEVVQP